MRDIIIIGSGGHSRAVISIVKSAKKWRKVSIIDTKYNGNIEKILTVPVVGGIEFLEKLNINNTDVFVAIGDNFLRRDMIGLVIDKGFKIPNLIHSNSNLDQDITLGYGNFIGSGANLGPDVNVGNGNIIFSLNAPIHLFLSLLMKNGNHFGLIHLFHLFPQVMLFKPQLLQQHY